MKILIDARPLQTYSRFRGIGRYVNELIHVFKDHPDVYFLFFSGNVGDPRPGNVITVSMPRRGITYADRIFLKPLIGKHGITVFHSTAFALPGRMDGISLILTIHDLTPLIFPEFLSRKNRFIFSRVLDSTRRADRIVAVSENTKEDLVRIRGISPQRIRVVYSPVNIPGCNGNTEIGRPEGIPEDFILYTGGFDGNKNVRTIVKALNIFKKPLVLTGMIREEVKKELTAFLKPGTEGLIHFTGYVSDCNLSVLYRKAKLFVFPSLYEGFGFPPLEALKLGTPSVVSPAGALKEVLKDAAVFLNDPRDEIELAKKITELWNDKAKRGELVDRGGALLDRYSSRQFKDNMMELYHSLHPSPG